MGPSRLPESPATLVLDASAVLNLLGTGRAADVLRLVGRETVIVEEAVREVERNPLDGSAGSAAIDALVCAGLLHIRPLLPSGYEVFANLVAAPSPDGLDDGEAATVAYAVDVGGIPLLDEKKATRIATTLPVPAPLCTLDLLSHTSVEGGWGVEALATAVYSALQHARMRIPVRFRPWIIGLVGVARLRECTTVSRQWLKSDTKSD